MPRGNRAVGIPPSEDAFDVRYSLNCSHWPMGLHRKCILNRNVTDCGRWPKSSPLIKFPLGPFLTRKFFQENLGLEGSKISSEKKTFRPFLTRKFFQEILGLEGSTNFLGKFRQVHNLKISDRLLRSKSFFKENIPGFICSVFRSA